MRPDQICDLLQVPCKPELTYSMVRLSATKPSPPRGFLVRRVYDMDTLLTRKPGGGDGFVADNPIMKQVSTGLHGTCNKSQI